MNKDDSTKAPKQLEGKAEVQHRPENNNKLDNCPDATKVRQSTAEERDSALSLNKNRHSGSAGGHGGSIEVVGVDKHGKQQVIASRETGTSKDFSKFAVRAQHISESELEKMAAQGDGFAKDVVRQLKTATTEEKRTEVQKNADRMYGRGEFALPKEEKTKAQRKPDTGILDAIKHDDAIPKDKRVLAEQIQEMRTQSKHQGISTDVIDQYAASELQPEIEGKVHDLEVAKALAASEESTTQKPYDYTKSNTLLDTVQEIAKVGIDKFTESEIRGKLKLFEGAVHTLAGPQGDTPMDMLKGAVSETIIENARVHAGIAIGCERFVVHTVEGLVSLARMGDALARRTTPLGWIYDPDPEGTKMLVNTMQGAAAMERMLLQFQTTLNPTSPLFGCEFDPEGTAAAKKILADLPEAIKNEAIKFGNTDTVNKSAVGTEIALNIASLFVGGGAGVAGKAGVAAELANVAKAGEFVTETGQGFKFFKLFSAGEKLTPAETLSEASLTTLQKYTVEVGLMAKTNRSLETLYQGLNKTLDQMVALIDEGGAQIDKANAAMRNNELIDKMFQKTDKVLKLPPNGMQFVEETVGIGKAAGEPAEWGLGKIIDNVLFMKKKPEPLPIKYGERMPEVPEILLVEKPPLVSNSGWKDAIYLSGDDQLRTVKEVAGKLGISKEQLAKMSAEDLEKHHLLRMSPAEGDLVVQERLRNQFYKILELSEDKMYTGRISDALASIRKILMPFDKKILEKNLVAILVPNGTTEEVYFAVNNIKPVPGTISPQSNRFFPTIQPGDPGFFRSAANHSEPKASNFVAEFFEHQNFRHLNRAERPVVWMLTEQEPCLKSCEPLIKRAKAWFAARGMELKVSDLYPNQKNRGIFVKQKFEKWGDK